LFTANHTRTDKEVPRVTEEQIKEQAKKMRIQARMFDMGHTPKERVVNRVVHRVKHDDKPSDEKLQELIADENTREDIQNVYGG
jgi:uncharacterized protein YneF (UPF0154 family)